MSRTDPRDRSSVTGGAPLFSRRSPALVADPYPSLATLRDRAPVSWTDEDGGHWVVAGYDAVRAVLAHPETFSSRWATIPPSAYPVSPELPMHADPPEHGRYRRAIGRLFTPAREEQATAAARRVAAALVADLAGANRLEVVSGYAEPFARRTFTEHLGIGPALARDLAPKAGAWTRGGGVGSNEMLGILTRTRAFAAAVRAPTAERFTPGGFLHELVHGPDDFTPAELVGLLRLLHAASVETVASHVALLLWQLDTWTELRVPLRTGGATTAAAVDELLRLDSGIAVVRQVVHDTELGGCRLAAGDLVLALVNAANRDPARFADADTAVVPRDDASGHLAFGLGPHRCAGARLARTTLAIAVRAFLDVAPDYRVDAEGVRATYFPLRELIELPVVLR